MTWLLSLYRWLERTCFQTLTRKLLGNLALLLAFQLAGLALFWLCRRQALAVLDSPQQLAEVLENFFRHFLLLALVGGGAVLFAFAFLRHLVVSPVRRMIGFFREQSGGEGDLSQRLPVTTFDEYQQLSEAYNDFLEGFRQMVSQVRIRGVNIAQNAALLTKGITTTAAQAHSQGELAERIFMASRETTSGLNQISDHTQAISGSTSENLQVARASMQ
jgi:methyl-accepting chemotaxis protein